MSSLEAQQFTAQRATHPRLHIRNAHEAHALFESVRLGLFPMVRRRLSPTERELQSGEVFVWEEASYKGGLERWTDGRKWSQSRMREPFLFYEEKVMPSREEKDAKAARRARKTSDPAQQPAFLANATASSSSQGFRRQDRPTKVRGLTKQTYSAYVTAPGSSGPPKKWHLTAYFSTTDYNELPTVQQDPVLSSVEVPKGVYVTGKGLTRKSNRGVGSGHQPSGSVPPPTPSSAQHQDLNDRRSGVPFDSPSSSFASPCSYDSPAATTYSPAPFSGAYSLPPSSMPTPSMSSSSSAFAAPTDEGSRSPWSSSSAASLPITPPSVNASLPSSHYFSQALQSASTQSYHQPKPSSFDFPAVFDPSSRPPSTLPPLRSASYLSDHPSVTGLSLAPFNLPPVDDKLPHSPVFSSFNQPPVYPLSFPGSGSGVGYPSSDVRGESYPLNQTLPSASGPATSSKYRPRSTTDQKVLGAFRLAL